MSTSTASLPPHLTAPTRLGTEISITGKWVPATPGSWFRKSPDSAELRQEWQDIHDDARTHPGVLTTELNYAVGGDAVLVHHVFASAEDLVDYFQTTAARHVRALTAVARPEHHLVRGQQVPQAVRDALASKGVAADFGEHIFGYVKEDYRRPDLERAVMVTAKWTCRPDAHGGLEALRATWARVGTDAYGLEDGLLRLEAYQVPGEDALILHEAFRDTAELRFHLTKGTAAMHKKELDRFAAPECYFFRGPVSWDIRTYSRFMHLPATYTSRGSHFTRPGGSMSEGTIT